MTKREQLIEALVSRGCVEVPSKSRKYRQFTRYATAWLQQPAGYYFVGKSGALRFGQCSTNSLSVSESGKAKLISFPVQK